MSRGLGRVQRAVLAYVLSEPGGLSDIDGTPLAASVTGLARVVYGVEEPSDAQRAAVRRAVRRLEAGGHVEVHRLRVGRTYTQQRAHPRFWPPRYDRRLAVCTGEDGCPGCAAGDRPSMYFNADVVAMFIEHYGSLAEADRQLWRATAHGWHLYPVPLPRPADDYRTYEVEITELCVRRALSAEEHSQAEQRAQEFVRPYADAIRAALRGR
ncbi:hypothetical protein BN159_p10 (plasmid) [Streptomyces davaonensis JCM 4913]|uniref:Uncharacterized protein n=1 Tax=Streptomyces davaonensis (strain DSM 101723 / JCM 4913 / KCC S-0913 / 768) TaxID=1214101 RepID=K4R9F1_STRDJ|nr:hypothetical protein [Streptomyces davaonensis]CCK32891.1 hypothetical protein BN159_p10 [Streptomyces davaonensis JCM 4913]